MRWHGRPRQPIGGLGAERQLWRARVWRGPCLRAGCARPVPAGVAAIGQRRSRSTEMPMAASVNVDPRVTGSSEALWKVRVSHRSS